MKRPCCVAFVGAMVGALWPAPARAQSGVLPVAITRSIEREASRLATLNDSLPPAPASVGQPKPVPADWSRIVALAPGREIILTSAGTARGRRHLLNADDVSLTSLNVTDPAIPGAVRGVLVDTAERHPDWFAAAQAGRVFLLPMETRLERDGVFQKNRKLFDLSHVIERVLRGDVEEIAVLSTHFGRHVLRGTLVGAGIGAVVGGIGAAGSENPAGVAAAGAFVGAVYGLGIGSIAGAWKRSPDVIYRR